jgi:hypothetical protein
MSGYFYRENYVCIGGTELETAFSARGELRALICIKLLLISITRRSFLLKTWFALDTLLNGLRYSTAFDRPALAPCVISSSWMMDPFAPPHSGQDGT